MTCDANSKSIIYRGDTFRGILFLNLKDPSGSGVTRPFAIPVGSIVTANFPGAVQLSTANSGEITISSNQGEISFKGSPTKSQALALTENGAVDVVVTDTDGNITTFEKMGILSVRDRANA